MKHACMHACMRVCVCVTTVACVLPQGTASADSEAFRSNPLPPTRSFRSRLPKWLASAQVTEVPVGPGGRSMIQASSPGKAPGFCTGSTGFEEWNRTGKKAKIIILIHSFLFSWHAVALVVTCCQSISVTVLAANAF